MNTNIITSIIYSVSIILSALIWRHAEITKTNAMCAAEITKANAQSAAGVYTIVSGGTDTTPLLLNKATGSVWRYYRNKDESGNTTDEGFTLLRP